MKAVNIGLIGFGTVGAGVVKALTDNFGYIKSELGFPLQLKKIADKDIKTSRPVKVDRSLLTQNPQEIIDDPEITIVIEAIGGVKPAKDLILAALEKGKHVVTSNKEVIAKHGGEIIKKANEKGVNILFEGAVGGGIPIIRPLRQCLAGNQVKEIYGIVNGTTNYILHKMTEEGKEFDQALSEAKKKGFAEPNPRDDIEGIDAAYKAVVLAAVAFGVELAWDKVFCEGISKITLEDIMYAQEIGYKIKLLATVIKAGAEVEARVHPTLVPQNHPLAKVHENFNAIYVIGDPIGEIMFYGPGAGAMPTASAIIGDLIDIARHAKLRGQTPTACPALRKNEVRDIGEVNTRYYIRLIAPDRPGVLAAISRVFAEEKVSIQAVVQKEAVKEAATIVIITHKVTEKNIQKAISRMAKLKEVKEVSNVIRVGLG